MSTITDRIDLASARQALRAARRDVKRLERERDGYRQRAQEFEAWLFGPICLVCAGSGEDASDAPCWACSATGKQRPVRTQSLPGGPKAGAPR